VFPIFVAIKPKKVTAVDYEFLFFWSKLCAYFMCGWWCFSDK